MPINQVTNYSNLLIGMFHSETVNRNKIKLLNSLIKNKGNTRIFIATSTLGCGINPKAVEYVIHFGPSFGLADYCQQIGRAGRNSSLQCHAILYAYPQSGKLTVSKEMTDYIKNSSNKCLRSALFSRFNEDGNMVHPSKPGHLCCSFCAKSCDCVELNCSISFHFESITETSVNNPVQIREISIKQRSEFLSSLEDFRANSVIPSSSNSFLFVPPVCLSGLTDDIIKSLSKHMSYIKTLEDVFKYSDIINRKTVVHVLRLLDAVFHDIDESELGVTNDEHFNFSLLNLSDEDNSSSDEECIYEEDDD